MRALALTALAPVGALLAALLGALDGAAAAPGAPGDYGAVAFAEIDGPIDRTQDRYLDRVLEGARAAGVDTLLVRINTDGGQVYYAREMFKRILDLERDGIRTVAFVDFRAISAGALIAYAHEELYMTETASIGDIGVILQSPGGKIEYAPEKYETVVRALLAQAAEQRGWSRGLLLKMTAHKQSLYRIALPDGGVEFVIEDDLPEFLARHPDIDREDDKQVIVYRGADRLLTLTGREAVKLSMASAAVKDLDAMYARLGIQPDETVDLTPRPSEVLAWALSRFAPILAGLAMLFIFFEIKTPGVGLWAGLAALSGAGFLVAQFSLDLVESYELVLIAVGLALVVAEVLTMAGGGLLAALGAVLAFAGLVLAFLPNEFAFDLDNPIFVEALRDAAFGSVAAVAIVAVGFVLAVAYLPRTAMQRRLALEGAVTATAAGEIEARAGLVGRTGVAHEALHPSGLVEVDGEMMSARVEHGTFVARGDTVEIIAVEFGEIVVRAPTPSPEREADDGR